ncbi:hypothetical protein BH09SUM1_BH09SUM1_11460 [soil metagenome]
MDKGIFYLYMGRIDKHFVVYNSNACIEYAYRANLNGSEA